MERYIQQLMRDLKEVSESPKVKPYIEAPPHMEATPYLAELALTQYQTIEELTGIERIAFPEIWQLTGDQIKMLNKAIMELFLSFNIEIADMPEDIPPEMLYDVITDNWDMPVQYLPSSGFDLEYCTRDPHTCPYGEYCWCGEEPDFPDEEPCQSDPDERIDLPF
jgi:hypothetical protein